MTVSPWGAAPIVGPPPRSGPLAHKSPTFCCTSLLACWAAPQLWKPSPAVPDSRLPLREVRHDWSLDGRRNSLSQDQGYCRHFAGDGADGSPLDRLGRASDLSVRRLSPDLATGLRGVRQGEQGMISTNVTKCPCITYEKILIGKTSLNNTGRLVSNRFPINGVFSCYFIPFHLFSLEGVPQ